MHATMNVDLAAARSYCILIMVVSRYSENKLTAASGYYLLLAMGFLRHLKYTQISIKTTAKSQNIQNNTKHKIKHNKIKR